MVDVMYCTVTAKKYLIHRTFSITIMKEMKDRRK